MSKWKEVKISDIFDVFSGATPSTSNLDFWNGQNIWITPYDLSKIKYGSFSSSSRNISNLGLKNCSATILPVGSIALSTRAPIGYLAIGEKEFCTNQGCKSLKLKDKSSTRFHYYNIQFNLNKIKKYGEGTTFAEISKKDLEKIKISLPPLPHQRKIARILTNVDNLIEKTESAIAKYKAIKQGMMHDLFTRGIDTETGKLRPTKEEAPHLYKNTELGWIPKEWEVHRIDENLNCPIRDFGSFSMTNLIDFLDTGIPFLKTEVIKDGFIDFDNVAYIAKKVHRLLYKSVVNKGDILFTKIGAIGRVAVYDGELGQCNSNAASAKISVDSSSCDKLFFALKLGSHRVIRDFEKFIISTPPRINLGEINSMSLELPKLNEQKIISSRINSVIEKIQTEQKQLSKLQKLKQGLMQDLLTGKKEVEPDKEDYDE